MIYKHKERYFNQDTIFWYDSDTGEYHSRKFELPPLIEVVDS